MFSSNFKSFFLKAILDGMPIVFLPLIIPSVYFGIVGLNALLFLSIPNPNIEQLKKLGFKNIPEFMEDALNIKQKKAKQESNSSKPKTVVQNGYTYTLNEQTGQYE